jgi:hypothetical protein
MSRMMKSSLIVCFALCMAASVASAQAPKMQEGDMPPGKNVYGPQYAERQKAHREMMQKMEASNAKLDELVAAMNAAQGDAKVDAIAAVVNELVAQRRAMQARMAQVRAQHGGGKGHGGGMGKGKGKGMPGGGGKAAGGTPTQDGDDATP